MRLQEEYFARHAIADPYVRYDRRSSLILQRNCKPKDSKGHFWVVATINFRPENNHPGHYDFIVKEPSHNSTSNADYNRNFFDSIPWKQVSVFNFGWDDYEDSVHKWAIDQASTDMIPIVEKHEKQIVIWNIFAYCSDYKLTTIPVDVSAIMAETLLVYENTTEDKLAAIEKVEHYLKSNDPDTFHKLNGLRDAFSNNNYAEWLGNLILHYRSAKEENALGFNKELALD